MIVIDVEQIMLEEAESVIGWLPADIRRVGFAARSQTWQVYDRPCGPDARMVAAYSPDAPGRTDLLHRHGLQPRPATRPDPLRQDRAKGTPPARSAPRAQPTSADDPPCSPEGSRSRCRSAAGCCHS